MTQHTAGHRQAYGSMLIWWSVVCFSRGRGQRPGHWHPCEYVFVHPDGSTLAEPRRQSPACCVVFP
eukprot:CAMPEP_0181289422 /NCGR_PEP_ID=MMETSP1101-20121128/873_1 /TAXON_ID=46948 /ORGANISM="Rhodomonas abbreviata, Strain Caron Lab Isolate" /LENGTH=65 /DNA_ID=CAMNT_0023393641 /DNA_START=225 /DNA_END=419 /DNA_ORIENTATION=+